MGRALWAEPCGGSPVGGALWGEPCGGSLVGGALWGEPSCLFEQQHRTRLQLAQSVLQEAPVNRARDLTWGRAHAHTHTHCDCLCRGAGSEGRVFLHYSFFEFQMQKKREEDVKGNVR